jgi:hypothetical protein
MPGALGPAAQRINTDTAGLTHIVEPNPGAPVGAIPHEIIAEALPTEHGGLSHLFTDNLIEPTTHLVDTGLARATNSVPGKLGGLIPQPWKPGPTPVGPNVGPAPGYAWDPARQPFEPGPDSMPNPIPSPTATTYSNYVVRIRKWLGF